MSLAFDQLSTKPLTPSDAAFHAQCIRKNPDDRDAINYMVEHSLREAVLFLRELSRGKLDDGELVGIAYKALERSARSFDPKHGHRFFYFAKKALRGVLIEHWRSLDTVKHSSSFSMETALIESKHSNARHPDLEDPETTSELEGRTDADFSDIYRREDMEQVLKAMKCLTKFERALVLFIRATGFSFRETAEEFGCSRAWVGLCYNRALDKLRAVLVPKKRLL